MAFLKFLTTISLLFFMSYHSLGQQHSIVIKEVSIVDVKSGAIVEDQTVLVEGDRIKSIGGENPAIPQEAEVIEANGKFLIPGLWDMHAHNIEIPQINQLFLAKGITGLRDIGGYPGQREKLNSLKDNGIPLPRYLIGHTVNGQSFPFHIVVEDPAEAVEVVDSLYQNNSDFVKPYSSLKPEVFEALMRKANELNLPAAGHVPNLVHSSTASKLGMQSFEHVSYILKDCTPLVQQLQDDYKKLHKIEGKEEGQKAYLRIAEKELATFDPSLGREIAKVLVENKTAVTPTLITMYSHWHRPVVDFTSYPEMQYVPEHVREWWKAESTGFTDKEWKTGQQMHLVSQELVRILHEEGVMLLAGTDSPVVIPGFSLHSELEFLVESGLSPLEALRTATMNPAIFLGRENELGSIEENFLADLVLLNENPLADISNTEKIYGVIVNGEYLDREEIDKMLEEIADSFKE